MNYLSKKLRKSKMNHEAANDKTQLGFWLYLMTDLLSFTILFATYIVLSPNTAGGPSGRELFELPFVLIETMILLISSFTAGLALLALRKNEAKQVLFWFGITFLLGISFLSLEMSEFSKLIAEGASWQRSAFLSAFFALVGTHGLHIAVGLLWMLVSMILVGKKGLNTFINSKLIRLILFWHFLDIVWIFIFTIVYLMAHS
ncbi:MAG: cytochrome o ubiquinol oxidase subunit III [Candidatus Doudnabacteria bacterium]|nr:cytochrome o ubiquinol oxidase subunit III [Candidatus Doudnabacteria bacterium]